MSTGTSAEPSSETSDELELSIATTPPPSGSSQASASPLTVEVESETDHSITPTCSESIISRKPDLEAAEISTGGAAPPRVIRVGPQSIQVASTNASSQHLLSSGPNVFTGGLATRSTELRQSQDGSIISPHMVNSIRCTGSHSRISYTATESFPTFKSGDVLIKTELVSPPREWRLQSDVLARHSSWFARSMQGSTPGQSQDFRLWFSYSLEEIDGVVGLVRQPADGEIPPPKRPDGAITNSIVIKAEDSEYQLVTSRRSVDPICAYTSFAVIVEVYDYILGAFYGILPTDSSNTVNGALVHAEQIVRYATTLDCLHLIRSHVGNTLLQYRQSLFVAIKHDPARWLILAQALQNDAIYTESLIHLIGAHPSWPWPTERSLLPEPIRHLITRESAELDVTRIAVEHSLLLLTIDGHSGPVLPQEDSQFDTWFIVATFRDILARQFQALEHSSSASLKRGKVFRQLHRGGSAYMVYKEMERLMKRIMPSAVPNLSEDLGVLKEFAREYVKGLARNELMLDVDTNQVGYLTCSRIGREDIPWRVGGDGEV
ncbi:hypothetical protein T440DRAFT_515065 [Plenodomus tracheiphilus IPT5]|uniref:BTB domain-containing protein n=1 Tax=Plenodomus tracheiphilus IPT5 TaxID=1408161 RepID=A0A6A7BFQ8_9PLEO|nr:hypothetical protein T440DRAFT_515065 [Plenodomus tracheiphilus IPT5]